MIYQDLAKDSNSVLLNILGLLRWAEHNNEIGGYDVSASHINGTDYMEYHTYNGEVVWDVKKRGGYPDEQELEELEKKL